MRYLLFGCFLTSQLFAQTITNYTEADGLLSDFVECVEVDMNNNKWFGTSIGLQKYDGVNWTTYNIANYPDMASDNIKIITAMSNGDVWIGTDNGASKFDGTSWVTYNSTNGLNNNQVKSIDEDLTNGDVWIGTMTGVSYFDGVNWLSYSSPDLHWSGVNSTVFDSQGDIWFASPLGGITHFDGVNFTVYDTSNGVISQNITDLIIDEQNRKWIGTGGGISVLNSNNTSIVNYSQMYLLPPPDTLNPVVNIALDSEENLWVAIYVGYLAVGGVAFWDSIEWQDFDVSDGLAGPNVRGIAIDNYDNVWVATSTGVSKIGLVLSNMSFESNDIKLTIFPNPTQDNFNVVSSNKIDNILIYNSLGVLIFSDHIDSFKEYNINTSSFSAGIYHVIFDINNNLINRKIVIE